MTMKWMILSCLVIACVIHAGDAIPDKHKDYPKKGGFVPVYIRFGNQPLASISPELAAAFQESSGRSSRSKLIQELNRPVRFSSESSSDEELRNDIGSKPTTAKKVDSASSESNSVSNESISSEKEAKEAIKNLLKQMHALSNPPSVKTNTV